MVGKAGVGDLGLIADDMLLPGRYCGCLLVGFGEGVGDCGDGAGAVCKVRGGSEDSLKASGGARVPSGCAAGDGGVA